MNQAEYRSQAGEVREIELVLLATPNEQAHFGSGGEVFAVCYGMVRVGGWWVSRWTCPWSSARRYSGSA